jgi:hypothetical protein
MVLVARVRVSNAALDFIRKRQAQLRAQRVHQEQLLSPRTVRIVCAMRGMTGQCVPHAPQENTRRQYRIPTCARIAMLDNTLLRQARQFVRVVMLDRRDQRGVQP